MLIANEHSCCTALAVPLLGMTKDNLKTVEGMSSV